MVFTRLMQMYVGRAQHREGAAVPPALALKPHSSVSLCLWPPLSRRPSSGAWVSARGSLYWPFKRTSWDSSSPVSPQLDGGPLFLALMLRAGEPAVGLGPLVLLRGPLQLRYRSRFSTAPRGVGPACFTCPPLLPVSTQPLLYACGYGTSGQRVCRCFSRSTAL